MIIFNLDGTIADYEHRKHFIDPKKNKDCFEFLNVETNERFYGFGYKNNVFQKWKRDSKSFWESCDKDDLIIPVAKFYQMLCINYFDIEIWSTRCESVRKKTEEWLEKHKIYYSELKMCPINNFIPNYLLKETWLDEALHKGKKIEFVFESKTDDIKMWRKRGIFVFNCCQHDEEF